MQVKKLFILFLAISSSALLIAQGQKSFDLNDVFRKGTFRTKSLPGFAYMKDGKSYIINKGDALEINHVLDGKSLGTYISSEQ